MSSSSVDPNIKLAAKIALAAGGLFAAYIAVKKYLRKKECLTITNSQQLVKIGTRKSQLAMWQANFVADALRASYPHIDFQVVGISTTGDIDTSTPLSAFESKGVFTKELDVALLANHIDVAVHCMKDLPTTLPPGLDFGSVLERGDCADALVLRKDHEGKTLASLPPGSVIGTSALRRRAVIAKHYPHLVFKEIRGNVNSRLAKLDRGEYDGLILAQVGLKRLNFAHRISQILEIDTLGYAVGQGALAILCRESDDAMKTLMSPLDHFATKVSCEAERGLLRTLQGGCKVPIAVRTEFQESKEGYKLTLHGQVLSVDGTECIDHSQSASFSRSSAVESATELGNIVGRELSAKGADVILEAIRQKAHEELIHRPPNKQ